MKQIEKVRERKGDWRTRCIPLCHRDGETRSRRAVLLRWVLRRSRRWSPWREERICPIPKLVTSRKRRSPPCKALHRRPEKTREMDGRIGKCMSVFKFWTKSKMQSPMERPAHAILYQYVSHGAMAVAKVFSCRNGVLSLICIKLTRDTALDSLENSTPLWYINKLNFDCLCKFANYSPRRNKSSDFFKSRDKDYLLISILFKEYPPGRQAKNLSKQDWKCMSYES